VRLSGLGVWNLYFLIKFFLYSRSDISFDFLANLAFFAFLALSFQQQWLMRIKHVVSVVVGIALFYHDSWLPPISRLTKQAGNVQDFSLGYFFEIVSRVVNIELILALFVLCIVYWYSARWLRYTSLSVIGFAYAYWLSMSVPSDGLITPIVVQNQSTPREESTAVSGASTADTPDQQLQAFYQQQAQLKTQFPASFNGRPFDVVVLNICSLATADLNAIGVKPRNLFSDFDILFRDFNSATSYSGPAAIRLLRASCGQTSQDKLFEPVDKQCKLFSNLAELGFKTSVALNHDGHFDDFIGLIRQYGGVSVPKLDFSQFSPAQYGFDGKPIYSDGEVLSAWLNEQAAEGSLPRALYYNSISLHDGNQLARRSRMNSLESYPTRQQRLFADIAQFISQLEREGRNVMLVVVPEHGAALKGDKLQFAGLREIPSPAIVSVPAAVKFIGPDIKHSELYEVEKTVSYFALSELISNAMKWDAFSGAVNVQRLVDSLPSAAKVAENQDTVMMYIKGQPYIQLDGAEWTKYPNN